MSAGPAVGSKPCCRALRRISLDALSEGKWSPSFTYTDLILRDGPQQAFMWPCVMIMVRIEQLKLSTRRRVALQPVYIHVFAQSRDGPYNLFHVVCKNCFSVWYGYM